MKTISLKMNINDIEMKNLTHKTMRKIAFALLMFLTLSSNAQEKDGILKFKGIPIDGTKSEMISKLKEKGFSYNYEDESFKGTFDGDNIVGKIITYNDKVYNIRFMYDVNGFSKFIVINRFNLLVGKYDINEKYVSDNLDKTVNKIDSYYIDIDEDILHEMQKGRMFMATYLYKEGKNLSDTTGLSFYKKECYRQSEETANDLESKYGDSMFEALYIRHKLEQDIVRFYIINMNCNEFNIMFDYYNRRNAPNGEDL